MKQSKMLIPKHPETIAREQFQDFPLPEMATKELLLEFRRRLVNEAYKAEEKRDEFNKDAHDYQKTMARGIHGIESWFGMTAIKKAIPLIEHLDMMTSRITHKPKLWNERVNFRFAEKKSKQLFRGCIKREHSGILKYCLELQIYF